MKKSKVCLNDIIIELHVPDFNVVKDFRIIDPFGYYLCIGEQDNLLYE